MSEPVQGELDPKWLEPADDGHVPMWIDVVQSTGKVITVDLIRIVESRLCVVTDDGEILPFKMNRAQRRFMDLIARDWNAGRPVRYIVLKARQLGISTIVEALITTLCAFQRNKQAIIVSKDPDSASDIFRMSKGFVENYRDRKHPIRLRKNNAKALQFAETKSEIQIVSVQKGVRGGTKQYAHLSEYAFWPNPDEVMTALMPSLHPKPHTIVIIESTANGFNDFMDRWNRSVAGNGGFKPFFLPWTEHPDYVSVYDGHELSPDERTLLALGISVDRLQWRRERINELGELKFRQEYPRTPAEAFQTSGTGVFDREKLAKVMERTAILATTCQRGRFEYEETYLPKGRGAFLITNNRFVPDPQGPVRIYQMPVPGAKYAIGGDTADGGIDHWAADVNLAPHGIEVATLDSDGLTAHQYACLMVCLGRMYNGALIAIEVNRSRAAMQDVILTGYKNTYVSHEEETIDQDVSNRDGFTMTAATKRTVITDMQTHFNLFPDNVNDHLTASEMATYVSMPTASGRGTTWGASSKKYHDDHVTSRAISLHAMQDIRTQDEAPQRQNSVQTLLDWVDETMRKEQSKQRRKRLW